MNNSKGNFERDKKKLSDIDLVNNDEYNHFLCTRVGL